MWDKQIKREDSIALPLLDYLVTKIELIQVT
jgi:hypothetical protein